MLRLIHLPNPLPRTPVDEYYQWASPPECIPAPSDSGLAHHQDTQLTLQDPPLLTLFAHILDDALQHDALAAALALKPGHNLREAIEAFADGLASLLLRGNVIGFLLRRGQAWWWLCRRDGTLVRVLLGAWCGRKCRWRRGHRGASRYGRWFGRHCR